MNPNARLKAARAATDEGRFEEALSEFVWFHEHALEVDRAYRGVRLSFALAFWLELAEQYPPALAEFQRKLNEKTTRLSSGELSRDLFNDIEAMNACIGKDEETVKLFSLLDKMHPEFAQHCAHIAVPVLIRAKKFSLAAKYVPDPEPQVLAKAEELVRDVSEIDARPRTKTPLYRAYVYNFTEHLQQIEALLKATGKEVQAVELRDKVMVALKPTYLRSAVGKQLTSDA